jgi:hypothetical protein
MATNPNPSRKSTKGKPPDQRTTRTYRFIGILDFGR